MPLEDKFYLKAWKTLQDRFENEREIVHALVRRILHQPLVTDKATSLRSLIDTTKECVKSLQVHREEVKHWDAILIVITLEKLETTIKRDWLFGIKKNQDPRLNQLFEFLGHRAAALGEEESTPLTQPQTHTQSQEQPKQQQPGKQSRFPQGKIGPVCKQNIPLSNVLYS